MDKREANKKETTAKAEMSGSGNLNRVLVSVDGSEESMKALRWALNNLKLRSPTSDSIDAPSFIIFHVQSPPSIATGLNPGAIPFGGPSSVHFSFPFWPSSHMYVYTSFTRCHLSSGDIEVPAFTAAIEAHQERITRAVLDHALGICSQFNLGVRFPFLSFFIFNFVQSNFRRYFATNLPCTIVTFLCFLFLIVKN